MKKQEQNWQQFKERIFTLTNAQYRHLIEEKHEEDEPTEFDIEMFRSFAPSAAQPHLIGILKHMQSRTMGDYDFPQPKEEVPAVNKKLTAIAADLTSQVQRRTTRSLINVLKRPVIKDSEA